MVQVLTRETKDDMKALLLHDQSVSPFELHKYDVIVASYSCLVGEIGRQRRFVDNIADCKKETTSKIPKRPRCTLLSEIFLEDESRPLGAFLILDEAHSLKNLRGRTYLAVKALRDRMKCCIMLTGTPLDNKWADAFALMTMLKGHPITSIQKMRWAFTGTNIKGKTPEDEYLKRFIQCMDAMTLRRPLATIKAHLPERIMNIVKFDLEPADLRNSNAHFKEFAAFENPNANSAKRKKVGKKAAALHGKGKDDSLAVKWSALVQAQQHAQHKDLVQIMSLERKAFHRRNKASVGTIAANVDDEEDEEDHKKLKKWQQAIRQGHNYRSPRVNVIIDLINKIRDQRPDDAILVFDESVYFLDILAVALEKMHEPVPRYEFNGRMAPIDRQFLLEDFQAATGCRVMLCSRGSGGEGLNIQSANNIIRCGPWWKQSWQDQADARVYRPGQKKTVYVYELQPRGCAVESYKRKVREEKNNVNQKIIEAITRSDNVLFRKREFAFN